MRDITPSGSVFLYGYPHVPRFSTGAHDPLECAALFVRGGVGQVLFLAHDLIWIGRPQVEEIRRRIHARTGVPETAILVSATHTHSGPVTFTCLSNSADPVVPLPDPKYLRLLVERSVEAGCAAVGSVAPAEIGLAVARAEGVGSHRHDPAGPADPDVPVLVARARGGGAPIGCMVVYGMHPTVLHEDSTLISADFPGFTRRFLRRAALPADCPVVYHNGPSGNQSPRHVARANTIAEAQRLGEKLGEAIAAAIPSIAYLSEAAVEHRTRTLPLIPRTFPSPDKAQRALAAMRERFARLKAEGASRQAVRTAECDVFGAEETAELAQAATDGRLKAAVLNHGTAEIQLIRLGPWQFVAWPGEQFVDYGLQVKARLPRTFLISIANGELQGYIVTADAARRRLYEACNAVFSWRNDPRLVQATVALAKRRN